MSILVRIPKRFYDDHVERDLPSPEVVRETKAHYYIQRNDPAFAELKSDAAYYASDAGPDADWIGGIRASAKATLAAMS